MMDENPSAFPHESYDADVDMDTVKPGMTLRDYFAGQAVGSVMHLCASDTLLPGESIESAFARKAYAIADAMLAARGPQ